MITDLIGFELSGMVATVIALIRPSGDASGVTDRKAIANAVARAGAGGGIILLVPGTYYVDQLSALAGTNAIWLRGAGDNATTLQYTTAGGIADLTATSFFTCSDMLIKPSLQRTAEYFHLDAGAGSCQRNRFLRLRIASPYKLASLNTCTTTLFEDIQFLDANVAWGPWQAGIALDGAATSTFLVKIRGGTAAGMAAAHGLIDLQGSTIDTVIGGDWDVLGLSGANMLGLYIANGQWVRFKNISIESGSGSQAVFVAGGRGIDLQNVHLLGIRGLQVQAVNGLKVMGGEILQCQREGILLSSGGSAIEHVHIGGGLYVSDCGLATTNTYDAIQVGAAANVTNFSIQDVIAGGQDLLGSANQNKYGIEVTAGASDFYMIANNRCQGATGQLLDSGTGTHKTVGGNI